MIFKDIWDLVTGAIKDKPALAKLQPLFGFASLFLAGHVLLYQYVKDEYQLPISPRFYAGSYLAKQFTVVVVGGALVLAILSRSSARQGEVGRVRKFLGALTPSVLKRGLAIGLVIVGAVWLFASVTPSAASHVRVKFLDEATGV